MNRIFVSHSRNDEAIRKFFSEAFAVSDVKAQYMEFEDLSGYYAGGYIANVIQDNHTVAVFVLFGPNIDQSIYTRNWVAFEVGVARDTYLIRYRQYLTQRVATSEDAETLINEGWRFVGILPNSKVILEMRGRLLSTDGIDR